MSRLIDLFIDSDQPIGELAARIEHITSLPFVMEPAASGWVTLMSDGPTDGARAVLAVNRFRGEATSLSRFPYTLSAGLRDGVKPSDAPEAIMLRLVGDQLHVAGLRTVLVMDMQWMSLTAHHLEAAGSPPVTTG